MGNEEMQSFNVNENEMKEEQHPNSEFNFKIYSEKYNFEVELCELAEFKIINGKKIKCFARDEWYPNVAPDLVTYKVVPYPRAEYLMSRPFSSIADL